MKIGLFFGSFNPIHKGHLAIAGYMLKHTDLRQVWFVVSPHNPFKNEDALLPDWLRLGLVRKAVGKDRHVRVCDAEFRLSKPSYTIHTLSHLRKKFPKHTFAIIAGTDVLEHLHKWKRFAQILGKHELFIYPRKGHPGGLLRSHRNVRMTKAPLLDFSATEIRKAVLEGKGIKKYLPASITRESKAIRTFLSQH